MIELHTLVVSVTLALVLAFVNDWAWGKKYIGFWWHTVQWLGVAITATLVVYFTDELWAALPVWSAIHWIVFEFTLYLLRGLPLRYVGKSALTDRVFQRLGEFFWSSSKGGSPNALAQHLKVGAKGWFLVGSLVIYSLICNC